jgi:hypothetical protein
LFSLSGNLESSSPQQIVQVLSDPLVEAVESTSLLLGEFGIVPKRPEYSGSQRSKDPVEGLEEDEADGVGILQGRKVDVGGLVTLRPASSSGGRFPSSATSSCNAY